MSGNSDRRAFLKELQRQGCVIGMTGKTHLRITHPDMASPVIMAATPSDHRAQRNTAALIRRLLRQGRSNRQ